MARSTVIKVDSSRRAEPVGLRAFRIEDVLGEARATIERARQEAGQIVQDARSEADRLRAAARDEGYRAGFEEGSQKGEQVGRAEALATATREFSEQQAGLVSTCQSLIAAIQADRAAWQAAARQDLIDLALAIARRVVHHVGEHERQAVLANLEEAVRLAGARSGVTILVNPRDGETARLFAQSLLELKEQWSGVRVVEEPEISPGGARIQWSTGAIDASLETQLDRIAEALGSTADRGEESESGEGTKVGR